MSNHLKNAISRVRDTNIEWVGLREVREEIRYSAARDGKPRANSSELSHGLMVEVLANGQFGYASTPNLDEQSIQLAIRKASAQAFSASRWAIHRFSAAQRLRIEMKYTSPVVRSLDSLSIRELNDLLIEISCKLKISPKIVRTEATAATFETHVHFVSSNGSDAEQKFTQISTGFSATAQEGSVVQKRTDAGMRGRSYQGGWEFFQTPALWNSVQMTGAQAVELLSAEECPSEVSSLILKPDQLMLQIHESIGHPLELDRILGDERNYAGSSFVKAGDFGKLVYGSPLMNVTFDPTISHELASSGFDDTGNRATREFIIKDGILLRGLGSLESQVRLGGIPGVANARACSWNRPAIDRITNINLEPGNSSFEDIISSVERGVIMEANRSWSIDDLRNKFQFGCEYGKLIENGKITRTVRNPNYRGITNPFWRSLRKVGDRSTFEVYGTPNCGKGEPNQLARTGHASPICLFENIEIFGGAS